MLKVEKKLIKHTKIGEKIIFESMILYQIA